MRPQSSIRRVKALNCAMRVRYSCEGPPQHRTGMPPYINAFVNHNLDGSAIGHVECCPGEFLVSKVYICAQ